MINRRVYRPVVAMGVFLSVAAAPPDEARGQSMSWSFPQNVEALSVSYRDNAIGGCWTNISETVSTMRRALVAKGYNVSSFDWRNSTAPYAYTIELEVNASRHQGRCYGFVSVTAQRNFQSSVPPFGTEHGTLVVGKSIIWFAEEMSANAAMRDLASRFVSRM